MPYVKVGKGLLDLIQSSHIVSRSIMLGASALYQKDTLIDEIDNDNVDITWELDNERVAGAGIFAASLYSVAVLWTAKKMQMQTRAALMASLVGKMEKLVLEYQDILAEVIEVQKTTKNTIQTNSNSPKLYGYLQDMNNSQIALQKSGQQIDDMVLVLEWSNRLGTEIQEQVVFNIGGPLLSPQEGGMFRTIDDLLASTTITQKEHANLVKVANASNNAEITIMAKELMGMEVGDDLFSIAKTLKSMKEDIRVMDEASVIVVKGLEGALDFYSHEGDEYLKKALHLLLPEQEVLLTKQSKMAKEMNQLLKKELLPKVGTAEKASETWLMRGTGKVVEKTTTSILKVGGLGDDAAKWGQKASKGVKWAGKGLGRLLWADTVIWGATGLYDLIFVEDVEGTYLGEHWGFSPIGWLIDSTVEAFFPEQKESFQAKMNAMILRALETDTIQDMVFAVVDFFVKDFNLELLPFEIKGNFSISPKLGKIAKSYDPIIILEVGIWAIMAKAVFSYWVLPAWGVATNT